MDTPPSTVALVTGSSRGIGRAIALRLARGGADVVVNHRSAGSSAAKAREVAAEVEALGGRAITVQADIADHQAVKRMLAETREAFGCLDVLVLNAARAPFRPLEKLLERELRQLVETNFLGHLFCLREALPLLKASRGAVIFVSSLGGRLALPAYPLGSMKAAMEAVVRDCAASLQPEGVAVNGVCPGLVRTDSWKTLEQHLTGAESVPEELWVTPEEVAEVVAFLISPPARAISGQTIVVDRGLGTRFLR